MRQGHGICVFADGTQFKGPWEQDMWVQSLACPHKSSVEGWGSARAVAGFPASFTIQVWKGSYPAVCCGPHCHAAPCRCRVSRRLAARRHAAEPSFWACAGDLCRTAIVWFVILAAVAGTWVLLCMGSGRAGPSASAAACQGAAIEPQALCTLPVHQQAMHHDA